MNCNKKSSVDIIDDDLKFIPLNIREPFSSKDSKWLPCISMNSTTINSITNNFITGFCKKDISNGFDDGLVKIPDLNVLKKEESKEKQDVKQDVKYSNKYENENNNIMNNSQYPSETQSEELYSYNSNNTIICNDRNYKVLSKEQLDEDEKIDNEPIHMELIRNCSLGLDNYENTRWKEDEDVEKIFKLLEENHKYVLGTLKAYKIPYAISSLLVKKIIKFSTENFSKE